MERVTEPDDDAPLEEWLVYLLHVATYRWAEPYARGQRVLDLGCGTGYGIASLAGVATQAVGVDVAAEAIDFATRTYGSDGAEYHLVADPSRVQLPFAAGSFDVVLSFQVIEHLERRAAYLAEAARVLAPGGVLLLATPDRATRLYGRQRPWNRFHLAEYDEAGLRADLAGSFASSEIAGMTLAPGLVEHEMARMRQAQVITLPFTFPGAPERWRQAGLGLLARAAEYRAGRRPPPAGARTPDGRCRRDQ